MRSRVLAYCVLMSVSIVLFPVLSVAQSESGSLAGIVSDPKGALVPDSDVTATRTETNTAITTKTNGSGVFAFPSLQPGHYRVQVRATGFKEVVLKDVEVHVQDKLQRNFSLEIGTASEVVNVEGGIEPINTQDATVSTVVDRQFAENLPMNGRSFQTLIELTPGVVLTTNNGLDNGQFSVNGQRAASNYWTVDGVSANIGVGAVTNTLNPGNGFAGAVGSFSVLGGTNSLVSVDALQEFRIQTSTYAPEFGRTPGGQISIATRSGTNQFHGTAFNYLRNDMFDASNWFNGFNNNPPLPKSKERQNDFGGTFSGPIIKDKTFFFFSYEGLRLRLPQTTLSQVPDLSARQIATPALQPYLEAFPFDPNQPDLGNGVAQLNASYSNPASLDAYSLRIDHRLGSRWALFGRYNYSPSQISQRGSGSLSLSTIQRASITTQTGTVGGTWIISPVMANDLRFNYSGVSASNTNQLDSFGGAVPLSALPLPSPFNSENANFLLSSFALTNGTIAQGPLQRSWQRQINIVDSLSLQIGSHSIKFGADFRRLTPTRNTARYRQAVFFFDMPSFESGNSGFDQISSSVDSTLAFHNLGAYAQDTWRIIPRLTLTYGLRWDVDFAPSSLNGPSLLALTGYDLNNLSTLGVAPSGTPIFSTRYGNVAPRVGVAYQFAQSRGREGVLRGGFGVFYDLATSEVGTAVTNTYPFGSFKFDFSGANFPLDPVTAAPPPITLASLSSGGELFGFDPHLNLPYTLEWNVALQQALGTQQTLSISYLGSSGKRLLQTALLNSTNASFGLAALTGNTAASDYNALQVQLQRRLSHALQALASYTWSHSIDDGSAGSYANTGNTAAPQINPNANRGPSDFDIRNSFSAGLTYDIPGTTRNAITNSILSGWSLESAIQARSAAPVTVYDTEFFFGLNGAATLIRPDQVPGVPVYLYGSQYPGGKAFNVAAFTPPPSIPIGPNCPFGGCAARQGDVPRNSLRGFGVSQWDFAVHREFSIRESFKLQFRAEMFNILNHPNFGQPNACFGPSCFGGAFGISTQMLGQYLSGNNVSGGAFSPLYQIGGPRSIQFALKLAF